MGGGKTNINKRVEKIIEFIRNTEKTIEGDITLTVNNLETKEEGIACYLDKYKGFKVYEGAGDGSDDRDYSIEEFTNKYEVISVNIELDEELEEDL